MYQKKEEFCIVNIKIKCSLSYRENSLSFNETKGLFVTEVFHNLDNLLSKDVTS